MSNVNATEQIEFSDNVHEALNEWYRAVLAEQRARADWERAYVAGYQAEAAESRDLFGDKRSQAGRNAAIEFLLPMETAKALATAHACWIAKLTGVPFVILERPTG